jgi:exonuclease SbcD
MKILHTSDWHLGRQFHGQSLHEAHAECLAQIVQAVKDHQPDVLIIAGDIYDRAAPPASAVRQFNGFMEQVYSETDTAIVLIAGNHDSGDRVAANSAMVDRRRVLIRGPLQANEPPLIVHDAYGPVAISALPFGNEYAARECFDDVSLASPADVLSAQVAAAKVHIPDHARWVIVAHGFVTSAAASDSERPLLVGGVETVPKEVFAVADYVALGHLHRPQALDNGRIRYSGAPMAFGFDEAGDVKSMALIDLGAAGEIQTTLIPFKPRHQVRVIEGEFAEILAEGRVNPSQDYIKVILTDDAALIDPMGQLRQVYPNAMALEYRRDLAGGQVQAIAAKAKKLDNPEIVVRDFLTFVRDEDPTDADMDLVRATLNRISAKDTD